MQELILNRETPIPILAAGSHQHNTLCLLESGVARISEDHGDLGEPDALRRFLDTLHHWAARLGPEAVLACDLHPAYQSTIQALCLGRPVLRVQHHFAHAASAAADTGINGPFVAVVCDGTGLGLDGTIWGGEIIHCDGRTFSRCGHLRTFPLPGGDASAQQPWRVALALVVEALPDQADRWVRLIQARGVDSERVRGVRSQLEAGVNLIRTSSLGRLFDGISFLAGVCRAVEPPGRAPMLLEQAASAFSSMPDPPEYPTDIQIGENYLELNWQPLISAMLDDVADGSTDPRISARFHATVARMLAEAAVHVARSVHCRTVVLSGGCFLNRLLKEWVCFHIRGFGIEVATPSRISTGDAGISLGQAVMASEMLRCRDAGIPALTVPSPAPATAW